MAEITATLVKELREKTGAGMMDCKKALTETKGDFEGAVDWLRKKGLSAAAKKAGRVAAEGLIGVSTAGQVGAMVEINAETDFVARNEQFQGFVRAVTATALAHDDNVESLKNQRLASGPRNVGEELTNMIATVGENMSLRRAKRLSVSSGAVVGYVHAPVVQGLGKIGVLVALESSGAKDKVAALGKQLAMHVAAAKPDALTIADVDAKSLERERNVLAEQARASGKPEAIIAKMVEGRLRKFYEEVVLMEQTSVIDNETKIAKMIDMAAKEIGAPVKVTGFARFALGEGIERAASDFAAEVAATARAG